MITRKNAIAAPRLGWSSTGRRIEHHSISVLSIQVTALPDGERYLEIVRDDRVLFGTRLEKASAEDLARLLMA